MKKRIAAFILLLGLCPVLPAQEAPAFFAEDFLNQSTIVATGASAAKQCQAVRILPNWYLTAAHCVRPYCDKECTVTVRLLQGNLRAEADIRHSSAYPRVFVPRQYRPGTPENIRYDIALIRFDPQPEDYFYYEISSKTSFDRETFLNMLKKSQYRDEADQWQALLSARPKLLVVSDVFNREVSYPLAVPDLRADGIFFKDSKNNPFYYFTELHYYMGPNFGIEKGMSGSGVVLPHGDIIGIVSASLSTGTPITVYDKEDHAVGEMSYSNEYFLFTPISRQNANFINATVNSFRDSAKRANTVNVTDRYAQQTDQTVSTAFGGALTVREILNSKEK